MGARLYTFLPNYWVALLMVGVLLLTKSLVPAGFMPAPSGSVLMVQLCSIQGTQTIEILLSAPEKSSDSDPPEQPPHQICAFGGFSLPFLSGLAPTLAARTEVGLSAPVVLAAPSKALLHGLRLRPPPHGPPVFRH
jgi:hypothetical protein